MTITRWSLEKRTSTLWCHFYNVRSGITDTMILCSLKLSNEFHQSDKATPDSNLGIRSLTHYEGEVFRIWNEKSTRSSEACPSQVNAILGDGHVTQGAVSGTATVTITQEPSRGLNLEIRRIQKEIPLVTPTEMQMPITKPRTARYSKPNLLPELSSRVPVLTKSVPETRRYQGSIFRAAFIKTSFHRCFQSFPVVPKKMWIVLML